MSTSGVIEWCEWCKADSGRTHAKRACCAARRASVIPGFGRIDAILAVSNEHGPEAGKQFRLDVLRAMSMRLARANKPRRLAQYGRLSGEDLELVKKMTMEEYEKDVAA